MEYINAEGKGREEEGREGDGRGGKGRIWSKQLKVTGLNNKKARHDHR